MAGKTDEAQADLARLAIIRKQREDAARKKDEERRGMLFFYIWSQFFHALLSFVITFTNNNINDIW